MTSTPNDRRRDECLKGYRPLPSQTDRLPATPPGRRRLMAALLPHLIGLAGASLVIGSVVLWVGQFIGGPVWWSLTLPPSLLLLLAGGLLMLIGAQILARAGRLDSERTPPSGWRWAKAIFVLRVQPTGDRPPPSPEQSAWNDPHALWASDRPESDLDRKRRFN
jgi:hypothetical protein